MGRVLLVSLVLQVSLILLISENAHSLNIKFKAVTAQTGSFICCETYAPTQQLFYCVLGNSPNFKTFPSSGVATTFAPSASGFGVVEQRVAAVQPAPTTPFPLGGWNLGDVFIGHSNGVIVKVTNGSIVTNPWIRITEETEPARQTVFDRTGTVYDGDLIVSFTYAVYRVKSDGSYNRIIYSTSFKNYEGLDIVPTDAARYGPLSGTILIPQNPYPNSPYSYCCDNPTNIAAIDKSGTISFYNTGCYTDQVFVVHEFDNFYGIDYGTGKVLSSKWDDLNNSGLDGEIILMCERWGYPGFSGLRRLYWDAAAQQVKNEPIYVDPSGDATASIWEHGCFSRGGSADVLPGGFCLAFYTSLSPFTKLYNIRLSQNILRNYGVVSGQNSITYSATGLPPAVDGATVISIVQDSQNGFYLQIVSGAPTGNNGGFLDLGVLFDGPEDANMLIRIQNDATDSYLWNQNPSNPNQREGRFKWTWSTGTRGVVIGPIQAIPAMRHFSFQFTVYGVVGLTSYQIANNGTAQTGTLSNSTTFSMTRISCLCGNGKSGDDILLKDCEYTLANTSCCTQGCRYKPSSTICASPPSGDPCSVPSYCTGADPKCPDLQLNPICSCTPPYSGPNCTIVRCDLLPCGTCNNYTECTWCCDTNTCGLKKACNKQFNGCPSCVASQCNGGSCDCGVCKCPPGLGGQYCNLTVDCTGNPVPVGQTPLVLDVCNICGGNGTTCLGCDGIPFGKSYDVCGVCGGDGSSCYNPCPGATCGECLNADACGWCEADKACYPRSYGNCPSPGLIITDCNIPLSQGALIAAGLGIGAIVGIAIGAAVFAVIAAIGSKKGYDAWKRAHGGLNEAQSNPMYNDSGRTGTNPFYHEMSSKK